MLTREVNAQRLTRPAPLRNGLRGKLRLTPGYGTFGPAAGLAAAVGRK
jgi:hypothetical protein